MKIGESSIGSRKIMGPKAANKATSKKPPKKRVEIIPRIVDRIISRRTFEPFDRPQVGCRFIRFRKRGEAVTGILGYPIANFRIGTSYPLQLDDGEIVEIVGNKLLHRQIREGELCGRRVEIAYQGREFLAGGHHRKIYRVYKLSDELFPPKVWDEIIKRMKKNDRKRE